MRDHGDEECEEMVLGELTDDGGTSAKNSVYVSTDATSYVSPAGRTRKNGCGEAFSASYTALIYPQGSVQSARWVVTMHTAS